MLGWRFDYLEAIGSFVAAAVCVCACGGSSEPNESAAGPMDAASAPDSSGTIPDSGDSASADATSEMTGACTAYATAVCSQLGSCSATYLGQKYGSVQDCIERTSVFCPAQFGAAGSALTPAEMTLCANAIQSQSCLDFETMRPPSCVSRGSLANAAGCEYDAQCQSGFCGVVAATLCGTCAPVPGSGDTCDPSRLTSTACDTGLICAATGCSIPVPDGGACQGMLEWRCATPVAQGGACHLHECQPPDLECYLGACTPAISVGSPCEVSCGGRTALDCVPTASGMGNECVAASFAAAGQPCDLLHGKLCASYATCVDGAGAPSSIGTCAPQAADGASCGNGVYCTPPAVCVGGTCQGVIPTSMCN